LGLELGGVIGFNLKEGGVIRIKPRRRHWRERREASLGLSLGGVIGEKGGRRHWVESWRRHWR
jgi:hypothetical protein